MCFCRHIRVISIPIYPVFLLNQYVIFISVLFIWVFFIQNLLGQFDTFKADLDRLRSKGGEIIRDSPEPEEKQAVQRALAEVNRQWLSLQVSVAVSLCDTDCRLQTLSQKELNQTANLWELRDPGASLVYTISTVSSSTNLNYSVGFFSEIPMLRPIIQFCFGKKWLNVICTLRKVLHGREITSI